MQKRFQILVWLYEQVNMWMEGCITGFDECMNLVLDDVEEIILKSPGNNGVRLCSMETVLLHHKVSPTTDEL